MRNYICREIRKESEIFTLKAILERAKADYPDLNIILNTTDANLVTEIFFGFNNDIDRCNAINSVIDATCKVCRENYAVLVFTAVNQYYHTSVIAMCLLSQEKIDNYIFALQSYYDHF